MIIDGYKPKTPIYFYWRDALEVIEYVFGNPVFAPYMQYDPQRLWTDVHKTERIYSEYMTGDFAWESQVPFFIVWLETNSLQKGQASTGLNSTSCGRCV
jgi:hypothetical protein